MAKKRVEPHRYRISIPDSDIAVWKWCDMQDSVSFSIRTIIKEYIKENGMVDATTVDDMNTPKRGRPSKKVSSIKPSIKNGKSCNA